MKNTNLLSIILLFVSVSLFSCSKKEDSSYKGESEIKLNILGIGETNTGTIASTSNRLSDNNEVSSTFTIDENTELGVTLTSVGLEEVGKEKLKGMIRWTPTLFNLIPNARYKLLVFDSSGAFVANRDYIRGSESSTPVLALPIGNNYTFIVYSRNSVDALEDFEFQNGTSLIDLNNVTVKTIKDEHLYLFKTTVTINSVTTNVDVRLKSIYAKVKVIFNVASEVNDDAAAVNDPGASSTPLRGVVGFSTELKGLMPYSPNYNISLKSGHLWQYDYALPASNIDGRSYNSGGDYGNGHAIVESSQNTFLLPHPTLNLKSIRLVTFKYNANVNGHLDRKWESMTTTATTNATLTEWLLENLEILPGDNYTLTIVVNPDRAMTFRDQSVVRIAGRHWMIDNLGKDNSNPKGKYYQWGQITSGHISSTASDNFIGNEWNAVAGTSDYGTYRYRYQKTTSDPCPRGFRVPLRADFKRLVDFTTNAEGKDSNGNDIRVFTSKSNTAVKLEIPYAGYINSVSGTLQNDTERMFLWSSELYQDTRGAGLRIDKGLPNGIWVNDPSVKSQAFTIRCVSDMKQKNQTDESNPLLTFNTTNFPH